MAISMAGIGSAFEGARRVQKEEADAAIRQQESEQRQQEGALRLKVVQQGLDTKQQETPLRLKALQQDIDTGARQAAEANRPIANRAVYAGLPGFLKQETGAKQVDVFKQMADSARSLGDFENADKFDTHSAGIVKAQKEGVLDVLEMIHTGMTDAKKAESLLNDSGGDYRTKPGSGSFGNDGSFNALDADTGEAMTMTKEQAIKMLTMAGRIKPPKPIIIPPGANMTVPQPDGSYPIVAQGQPRLPANRNTGSLTLPQQRTNATIEDARHRIAGMSQQELRKKTAKYTNTGRENPDYDPMLEAAWKRSSQRKYGEDSVQDNFQQAQPDQQQDDDVQQRFASDPETEGMRLGAQTTEGFEVFDASGKLVGYFD